MKISDSAAASLKGPTAATGHIGLTGSAAAPADGDTAKPAANEALAVSLLPGTDDATQQQDGNFHDVMGNLIGGRGDRREVDTDTTPDDDGSGGMRDLKGMFADDGEGKSYDAPWNDPDGGKAGYEQYPNGDGVRNVYPNGDVEYFDENGHPENNSNEGQTIGEPAPADDEPADDEPADDEPKEDPPKEDKPKEDPPKADKPKEDPPKDDAGDDDAGDDDAGDDAAGETDNTPPDGCTPGTVPACGGDEDHAPIPEGLMLDLGISRGLKPSSQTGGDVDPVEGDGTGWISGIATDAEVIDLKDKLLGCDLDGEGPQIGGGGGSLGGETGSSTSPNGGAIDWGPDHTNPQGSGPEERNTQHEIKPEAETEQDDDTGDENSSGSAIELVAVQDERGDKLRDAVEKNGGLKQDKAIDPDRLEKFLVKEVAPGDFADLLAPQKAFEFLPVEAASLESFAKLALAKIDLDGTGLDLQPEAGMFTAPAVAVDLHHAPAELLFDLDFA